MGLKVFIIAGEPSGDRLGGAAMVGLKSLRDVEFRGVGGAMMQSQGLDSQFEMSELSIMGVFEILPKYFHLKRRIRQVADAILAWQPDVVLTVDSPDFCLRVADLVKQQSSIRICHYVAPTVWAWRPKRAAKMASRVDQVLALFPFEPPYFEREGLRCDFVGHPVVSEEIASQQQSDQFRAENNVGSAPLVLVLPGSRRGEISKLAPCFGAALGHFAKDHPEARYVLPVAQGVAVHVAEAVADWPVVPILIPSDEAAQKCAAFKAADLALAASGTVSLELAANDTPMVIAYKMHPLTFRIIKSKMLIDTVTLVNVVTGTRVVPEFLGPQCTAESIACALNDVVNSPDEQAAALSQTMLELGQGGAAPGLRAAQAILDGLNA